MSNMISRDTGRQRLAQQQQRHQLDQHAKAIHELIPGYCQHRDAIAEHLNEVSSKHLYLASHKSFKAWFEASGFIERLRLPTA